jgi:hypothetical protein
MVVIARKLIDQTRTIRVLKGISPALAVFDSRFQIRISLLSEVFAARLCVGFCGSLKGGLWYVPVDLCHFVILYTSVRACTLSSLSVQYNLFALQIVFQRFWAVRFDKECLFLFAASLQASFY